MSHTVMVPSFAPDIITFGFGLPVSSGPTQVTVPCSSCKHRASALQYWDVGMYSRFGRPAP